MTGERLAHLGRDVMTMWPRANARRRTPLISDTVTLQSLLVAVHAARPVGHSKIRHAALTETAYHGERRPEGKSDFLWLATSLSRAPAAPRAVRDRLPHPTTIDGQSVSHWTRTRTGRTPSSSLLLTARRNGPLGGSAEAGCGRLPGGRGREVEARQAFLAFARGQDR